LAKLERVPDDYVKKIKKMTKTAPMKKLTLSKMVFIRNIVPNSNSCLIWDENK